MFRHCWLFLPTTFFPVGDTRRDICLGANYSRVRHWTVQVQVQVRVQVQDFMSRLVLVSREVLTCSFCISSGCCCCCDKKHQKNSHLDWTRCLVGKAKDILGRWAHKQSLSVCWLLLHKDFECWHRLANCAKFTCFAGFCTYKAPHTTQQERTRIFLSLWAIHSTTCQEYFVISPNIIYKNRLETLKVFLPGPNSTSSGVLVVGQFLLVSITDVGGSSTLGHRWQTNQPSHVSLTFCQNFQCHIQVLCPIYNVRVPGTQGLCTGSWTL